MKIARASGNGGPGKTSVGASFVSLASKPVVADCDLDGAQLHLVLDPGRHDRLIFSSGQRALVDPQGCCGCGECEELCSFGAIDFVEYLAHVDPLSCQGCGVCVEHCPIGVISLQDNPGGRWLGLTAP